jgi:pimeloyl-ACP methyl ester carboxylesterase
MKKLIKPGYITAGVAISAFLLFGRYLFAALTSKKQGEKLKWNSPEGNCYIKCPGGNLWYAEFDGPAYGTPIVFIHGMNANHQQWYYQREHFKHNHRLIFLDLPIHLKDATVNNLSIPALAADIKYVLDKLNIKGAIAYGHSMGGTVLMEYCLQHANSENLKAIILHGTPYKNPLLLNPFSLVLRYLQQPVIIPLANFLKRHSGIFNFLSTMNFLNGLSVFLYRYVHFCGNQTANQLIYVTAMAPKNDTGALAESLLQLMRYDASGKLNHIKLPTLIISGKHDRLNTIASGKYIHWHIANSTHLTLPHGHQSMVEDHAQLNKLLHEFVSQQTLNS